MMPGFGIVIINDKLGSQYSDYFEKYSDPDIKEKKDSSGQVIAPECYNTANSIATSLVAFAIFAMILW